MPARKKNVRTVLLTAASRVELLRGLYALEEPVPPRHVRLGWQVEQWAVIRLLLSLPPARLTFPLSLTKDEKPDFILSLGECDIAIEHTEAISQKEAHIVAVQGAMRDAGAPIPRVHPEEIRHPTDVPLSRKEAEAYQHTMTPYVGDAMEDNWLEAMQHFIREKLGKYPTYAPSSTRTVLVYDNWGPTGVDLAEGSRRLQEWLLATKAYDIINSVFLIHSKTLLEMTSSGVISHQLLSPP
jgi:hypothetical protein